MRAKYITLARAMTYIKEMISVMTLDEIREELMNRIAVLDMSIQDDLGRSNVLDTQAQDSILFYKRVLDVMVTNKKKINEYSNNIQILVDEKVKEYNETNVA